MEAYKRPNLRIGLQTCLFWYFPKDVCILFVRLLLYTMSEFYHFYATKNQFLMEFNSAEKACTHKTFEMQNKTRVSDTNS